MALPHGQPSSATAGLAEGSLQVSPAPVGVGGGPFSLATPTATAYSVLFVFWKV